MRRITLWALSTLSALVLLFSYHTSTSATASPSVVAEGSPNGTGSTASGSSTGSGSTGSGSTSGSGGAGATTSPSSSDGTYTGDAVMTRYGAVQVAITVKDGAVVSAEVTQVPWSDRRDQMINSRAVPVLNAEAVDAQSAQIDMVSGATYTSEGYAQSLQSALDQANL
jgi:uncharacterized protein with FMN-binding domain